MKIFIELTDVDHGVKVVNLDNIVSIRPFPFRKHTRIDLVTGHSLEVVEKYESILLHLSKIDGVSVQIKKGIENEKNKPSSNN